MKRKWSKLERSARGGRGVGVEMMEARVVLAGVAATAVASDAFGAVTVGPAINISRSTRHEGGGTIAVDPTNPSRVFAASEADAPAGSALVGAFSTDGGATWTTRPLADGTDGLARGEHNPQATFDRFGNLYLSYLETVSRRAVHVAVSTDGGATFAPLHAIAGSALDQPSIAAGGDAAGTNTSSVWVTYRNTAGGISAAGARASGRGAVGPFGSAQAVPGGVGNFGDVAVGPQGQLIVTWQTNTAGEGPAQVQVSTDVDGLGPGGFSRPRMVAATNVGGFDFLPAQPNRSIDAEANLAYDLSPGPRRGDLYLAYTDENPDEGNDFDVLVRRSTDHGQTWSAPVRVNDDATARSQFLPEIAVDAATGKIAVGWYDAREDGGVPGAGSLDAVPNNDVAYWGAVSTDGGATFQNFRAAPGVSSAAAAGNPNDLGNYSSVAIHNGVIRAAWADNSAAVPDNPERPKTDLVTAAVVVGPQAGPRVVASDPAGAQFAAAEFVDFHFDRRMDPATFDVSADVRTFTGPAGPIRSQITGAQWLNNDRTLRVSFQPQSVPGPYAMAIGPSISSVGGAAMDQNASGTANEFMADRYGHAFALTPPRVVAHGPASPKVGTLGNFDFEFNQPMDPASFVVADDVVAFTGPGGDDLRSSITGATWQDGNRTLRINFEKRGGDGQYALTLGQNILGANGLWALDQDGDHVPGEPARDHYTASLTIDRSTGPDPFGYEAWTHAFQFVDLVPGATGVTSLIDDADDAAAFIPLGTHRFNFYGRTYTGSNALYVSTNGLITFGDADTDFRNGDLSDAPRRPAIAALWDDWRTDVGIDSRVLYRFEDSSGDGTPDRLVVEWNMVPNGAGGSATNPATFQAILELNSGAIPGEILLNYADLDVTAVTANNGAGATVGIKDEPARAENRLIASLNWGTGPYVATGKTVRIATTPQPAQPPTAATLVDSPDPARTDAATTLTATSVTDVDGGIAAVNFYRESNGRSGLQTGSGGDTLVGSDPSSVGGYSVLAPTTGLDDDTYTYYAQAVDDDGLVSNTVTTIHRVDNAAPTVDIVNVSPDPRSATLASITIRFSEAVTGFNLADLTLKRNNGANLLTTSQSLSTSDGGVTWSLGGITSLTAVAGNYTLALTAEGSGIADVAGNLLASGDADAWRQNASVVSRMVFYNDSNYDRVGTAALTGDDIAVAADKTALLPGQKASFANVTSYIRGINGVMIDMWGLVGTPSADDFEFHAGNGGDPDDWDEAAAPATIVRRAGDGEDGSTRLVLTWAGGAVRNGWLRVTLKANADTGLASPDVFYFGNLVGEVGDFAASATTARVTAFDLADVRRRFSPANVLVTNRWDFNRDGKVTTADYLIARRSYQRDVLSLPTAPDAPPATSLSAARLAEGLFAEEQVVPG